jgi:hypothetical protein
LSSGTRERRGRQGMKRRDGKQSIHQFVHRVVLTRRTSPDSNSPRRYPASVRAPRCPPCRPAAASTTSVPPRTETYTPWRRIDMFSCEQSEPTSEEGKGRLTGLYLVRYYYPPPDSTRLTVPWCPTVPRHHAPRPHTPPSRAACPCADSSAHPRRLLVADGRRRATGRV